MNIDSIFKKASHQWMDALWYASAEAIHLSSLSIPFLNHELIINFGDEFQINGYSGIEQVIFSDIKTRAIQTIVRGRYETLGILFSPIGVYTNYGVSLKEFNEITSIDDVFFNKKEEFFQILTATQDKKHKIEEVIRFFQRNAKKKKCPAIVLQFMHKLTSSYPIQIKQMAQEIGFSHKHLRATFQDVVGVSPKKYLQILQINHTLRDFAHSPQINLTEIALNHGFYDQSHFIRVFKSFAGMTPSAFRKKRLQQSHDFENTIFL